MKLYERRISIPSHPSGEDILTHIEACFEFHLRDHESPIRFAVVSSDEHKLDFELGILHHEQTLPLPNLFEFRKRAVASGDHFNVALIIPTGIGCEIGGHAGDATPVARMLAQICDTLVLHPNVVNASDINELPSNSLYVEGSVLSRLFMGAVGLQRVRSNGVAVFLDDHPDPHFINSAINTVSAARATYGLDCPQVTKLNPPIQMWAEYSDTGVAVGRVEGLKHFLDVASEIKDDFSAIAISSVIKVPHEYHLDYFMSEGSMVNPWGGVEAILTHTVSSLLNVPTAHAPMFESQDVENLEPGIIDPRMSAEAVSVNFLQCVLKGLYKSPKIVTDKSAIARSDVFSVEDISCLVIPDGCVGLPTLAAVEQGIPTVAVRENKNLMKNDLERLPWSRGQLAYAENYLEAAGMITAMKAGITSDSVRRPLARTKVVDARADQNSTSVPTHAKLQAMTTHRTNSYK